MNICLALHDGWNQVDCQAYHVHYGYSSAWEHLHPDYVEDIWGRLEDLGEVDGPLPVPVPVLAGEGRRSDLA